MFDRSLGATYTTSTMGPVRGNLFAALITSALSTVVAIAPSVALGQQTSSEEAAPTPKANSEGATEVTKTRAPDAARATPAERTTRPDARRSDDRGLTLRSVNASRFTNDQKKVNVEGLLTKQRTGLALVTDLTADARARKDIVQLNCVNAKRTQLKGLLRLSQQAASSMYEGMATAAEDTINHEYTKIAVASQRSQLLVTEAKQCVGEEAIFTGETDVTVEISSDIPTVDPTLPDAPPLGPAAPPVASGF